MNIETAYTAHASPAFRQKGLTLVELLVAVAIGLIITVAAGSVYLVAQQGFRTNDDQTRILENGRLAMELVSRNARMAGAPTFVAATPNTDPLFPAIAVQGTEGGAAPDSVTFRYWSDRAYDSALLTGADCLGQSVGVGIVQNTYAIANQQLTCQGNGGAPPIGAAQPIVTPVVDLQVQYGISSAVDTWVVDRIVTANNVPDWRLVRMVDVCVELISFEPNTITGTTPGVNCRGVAFPNDNRVHRLFRTSVNVRNSTRGNIFDPSVAP
ncbi:MAG: PilW family protein [Burkholderiaceae bacterium]